MRFLLQLINGLQVGSIYALIALGYTMVYGIVKLINFAHGDIIMVGAYAVLLTMTVLGWPVYLSIPFSILVCAAMGVLIERVAYKRLRSYARISALITAIGVSLLLENSAQLIFSPTARPFPTIVSMPPIVIGSLRVSFITVLTLAISVLLMILLTIFVKRTKTGKAMRAVSEDMGAAQLMGISLNRTISFTFAIGSALAGIGSVLYLCAYQQASPTMGSMLGLKAFVAAVLGGIGSIPGAMIGGFAIGLLEALVSAVGLSVWKDGVVFAILIVVLLVKPTGILGRPQTEKV